MRETVDLYEEIAAEYYDPIRHPTSANFREASRRILEELLPGLINPTSKLAEVGCGDSLVMAVLTNSKVAVGSVTLIDSSPTMLAYSERWRSPGVELVLADAEAMPVGDSSFDLIVSVLGDPYNTPRFWAELHRTLRPGGHILYTTPSYEWSTAFRGGSKAAVFDRSIGDDLAVRSIVLAPQDQRRMIEISGFVFLRQLDVSMHQLVGPISPKLRVLRSSKSSVVTAYLAQNLASR